MHGGAARVAGPGTHSVARLQARPRGGGRAPPRASRSGVVKTLATGKGKQKHSTLAPPTLQTHAHCTSAHQSEAAAVMP